MLEPRKRFDKVVCSAEMRNSSEIDDGPMELYEEHTFSWEKEMRDMYASKVNKIIIQKWSIIPQIWL